MNIIYILYNIVYTHTHVKCILSIFPLYHSVVGFSSPARPGKGAGKGQGLWSDRLAERGAGTKRPAAAEPADAEVPSRGWRSMVNGG